MKSGRKYLTIRKFSELTHTTVDTLKHYDEIGLLTPAYIGENKYRYYLPEQSLILTRILFGKHAGIPLKEIRSFIHSGHHTDAIQKYNEIINDLRARGKETDAIVSTIGTKVCRNHTKRIIAKIRYRTRRYQQTGKWKCQSFNQNVAATCSCTWKDFEN